MTNNKSEHCNKCLGEFGTSSCVDGTCECHLGDSLRKQEEKCEHNNPDELGNCYDCGIDQFIDTPKVATSEKECNHIFTKMAEFNDISEMKCIKCAKYVTPHESEDWHKLREEYKAEFSDTDMGVFAIGNTADWWIEKLKEILKKIK